MRYGDIIGVRANFDDTFNIIQEKLNSWKGFITNSQFENNLNKILLAFSAPQTDSNYKKSIWVQGTYGTGKSHSTSVVKHILCDEYEEIEDFINTIQDKTLKYKLTTYRKNHRAFPVVLKGRYTIVDVKDMLYVLQQETRNALKKAGIEINIKTDYETAINMLDNESYDSWWNSLLNNELKIYCKDKEQIRQQLLDNNKDILNIIDNKFKKETGGSFGTKNIIEWLKDVKRQISAQGVYDGLFIIWDEFTSLLSGQECRSILNTVQDIAELSNAYDNNQNPENIYILLVTHKNMEQTDAYRQRDEEEKKLAQDRFINCEYKMQPNTIYHILSSSLNKKDESKLQELIDERIKKSFAVTEVIDKIVSDIQGDNKEVVEKIVSLYPIHPYTAYLSTFVSRQLGASERSVFNYLNDQKVGFKGFLNEKIDEKLFLLSDSIWDFFLTINNVSLTNPKLGEIINKYNLHLDDVKKKGKKFVSVFKTVLLLNALNSVVDNSEDVIERNLVKPNETNIIDCYAGVLDSNNINGILEFLDQHNIIMRSPDGLFEVSTSAISQKELHDLMLVKTQYYNEITKAFSDYPFDSDELRKYLKTNSSQTVRNVEVIEVSSTLKNPQIETNIQSKIENPLISGNSLFVLEVFSHEDYADTDKLPTRQRSEKEIEDSLVKMSLKENFSNVVFVNVREKLPAKEMKYFIEYTARYDMFQKNNTSSSEEGKRAQKNAGGTIKKWIQHIIYDGELFVAFRGKGIICKVSELANDITNKYIPFIFDSGLDKIRLIKKEAIWKEKNRKSTIETFLYQQTRDDIESKLKCGDITNLKPLLKDDDNNYIFDNSMNLLMSAPESHPVVKAINTINKSINIAKNKNPIINLANELRFLFEPPFGYSGNMVSYATVCIALKQYIDKIFIAKEGTKVINTTMKDLIEALFNAILKGKQSSKLSVRFSSDDEIELIDQLNSVFGLKEQGLVSVRWKIREKFKTDCGIPLWMLKVITEDSKLIALSNELFNLTVEIDDNISITQMKRLNKSLIENKYKLITLINKAKADKNLMLIFIKKQLKELNILNIDDSLCLEYKQYIEQHSQEDVCYLKESDISAAIIKCYQSKIKPNTNNISKPNTPVKPSIETPIKDEPKVENTIDIRTKILNYNNDYRLKQILLIIIKKYPDLIEFINKELGD